MYAKHFFSCDPKILIPTIWKILIHRTKKSRLHKEKFISCLHSIYITRKMPSTLACKMKFTGQLMIIYRNNICCQNVYSEKPTCRKLLPTFPTLHIFAIKWNTHFSCALLSQNDMQHWKRHVMIKDEISFIMVFKLWINNVQFTLNYNSTVSSILTKIGKYCKVIKENKKILRM